MMVDRRTYTRGGRGLAYFLAERGWRVFVADFRAEGIPAEYQKKVPNGPTTTSFNFDLPALVSGVRARPDEGLVYIGHSLGGHTGLAAAGTGLFRPLQMPTSAFRPISGAQSWSPTPIFD